MRSNISGHKYLIALSIISILAISYAGTLIYENKNLKHQINKTTETNEKLAFLLSLERPIALTAPVQEAIEKLDDHMYKIRNDQKEKKFARCMMQAITEMTGSMGIYIDLNTCGEHINNKSTLSIFKELDSLEVAPECKPELIKNQIEFNACRNANEDYSAKTKSMSTLFKLITSHTLWEMHSISSNEYGKY